MMLEKQQQPALQEKSINIALNSQTAAVHLPKSRTSYILLGIFLGCLGIHNFYAGYQGRGLAQLLVTLFLCWTIIFPFFVGIWALVEACTVTKDADGIPFV